MFRAVRRVVHRVSPLCRYCRSLARHRAPRADANDRREAYVAQLYAVDEDDDVRGACARHVCAEHHCHWPCRSAHAPYCPLHSCAVPGCMLAPLRGNASHLCIGHAPALAAVRGTSTHTLVLAEMATRRGSLV